MDQEIEFVRITALMLPGSLLIKIGETKKVKVNTT